MSGPTFEHRKPTGAKAAQRGLKALSQGRLKAILKDMDLAGLNKIKTEVDAEIARRP